MTIEDRQIANGCVGKCPTGRPCVTGLNGEPRCLCHQEAEFGVEETRRLREGNLMTLRIAMAQRRAEPLPEQIARDAAYNKRMIRMIWKSMRAST